MLWWLIHYGLTGMKQNTNQLCAPSQTPHSGSAVTFLPCKSETIPDRSVNYTNPHARCRDGDRCSLGIMRPPSNPLTFDLNRIWMCSSKRWKSPLNKLHFLAILQTCRQISDRLYLIVFDCSSLQPILLSPSFPSSLRVKTDELQQHVVTPGWAVWLLQVKNWTPEHSFRIYDILIDNNRYWAQL